MSRAGLGLICAVMLLAVSGCGGWQRVLNRHHRLVSARPGRPARRPRRSHPSGRRSARQGRPADRPPPRQRSAQRSSASGLTPSSSPAWTPTSGKVAMVSLPRDTVNVPTAPGRVYAGRINALFFSSRAARASARPHSTSSATRWRTPSTPRSTTTPWSSSAGSERLVKTIGGVTRGARGAASSTRRCTIGKRGLRLKAGPQRLDGKAALAFTRSRHTSSDYDRSRRQHQVLAAPPNGSPSRVRPSCPRSFRWRAESWSPTCRLRAAPALLELAGRSTSASLAPSSWSPPRWTRQLPGATRSHPASSRSRSSSIGSSGLADGRPSSSLTAEGGQSTARP